MANILFIAYDFPPILSPESIQVQRRAVTLANNGHRVVVLTSHTNTAFEFIDESLIKKHEKIEVIRTKRPYFEKPLNLFFKFYDLTDRKLWWKTEALNKAVKILQSENIDVIYTHSTPLVDHIVGLELKRGFPNTRWIAHFSDPWTLNPYKTYRFNWQFKLNREHETKILKGCDLLTVTSIKTKELFEKEFRFLDGKVVVLPHTYDESLYEQKEIKRDKKIIVHTGNIYGLRTIKHLLGAIKNSDFNDLEFHFYGRVKKDEADLAKELGLQEVVKFFGQVGYFESIKKICEADFLLVVDAPLKNSVFFPSKLADYIGAKKLIMALTPKDSTTADILDEIGCNKFVANSDDEDEIKEMLKRVNESIVLKKYEKYSMKNYEFLRRVFER